MLLKYVEIFPEKYPGKFQKFSRKIWNFPDNFSASQHYWEVPSTLQASADVAAAEEGGAWQVVASQLQADI